MANADSSGRPHDGLTPYQRSLQRRELLLAAGLDLFASEGWHATTIQALCARAGISQADFYEEFTSRDAVFITLMRRASSELEQVVREAAAFDYGSPADRAHAAMRALAEYFAADARVVSVTLVESFATPQFQQRRADLLDRIAGLIADSIDQLTGDRRATSKRAIELGSLVLAGGLAEILIAGLTRGTPVTADELADELAALLTHLLPATTTLTLPPHS